ncbi:DUF4440 domain-containing protein [Rudanella paleaurantiibacter]|uniref:DUF4440 domain-containing protein n=1 Tax=Rudanella paleaurantiibacter TaxID=2614655 RepID=A0A7J5U4B4_9BACT|nr:nuclear transport factor 2 family protein [Rudanella paleaurantiibacter]KAB7732606.1 DUF4440 domain-containing protein [Rudanella paleaurantiibacter]
MRLQTWLWRHNAAGNTPAQTRLRCLFVWLSLLPLSGLAQKKVEDQIRQLTKQRFDAQVRRDTVFLEKVLATDLVYHHPDGVSESKRDFIHNVALPRVRYTAIEVEDATVRVYRTTAVATGKARLIQLQNSQPTPVYVLYTDVYVKGRWLWQLVSSSLIPVPTP